VDRDDELDRGREAPSGSEQPQDPLLAVRAELEGVDELPLEERATVFDRTHGVVVEELRQLELG
jgi:hypothetical protein